jgi:formylglycine-generating enzyme required for sulfatase activity
MGNYPSEFMGDNLPVEMISWYDCIEYCNKRSLQENLDPYYNIDKDTKDPNNVSEYDDLKWTISINETANGYRLPTEAEWEYTASGGQKSKNYIFSGSDNATKPIGTMKPNELGLYDMSGNVREWCYWYEESDIESGSYRVWKGGGWLGEVKCCELTFRGKYEANGMGFDSGFRICRNK